MTDNSPMSIEPLATGGDQQRYWDGRICQRIPWPPRVVQPTPQPQVLDVQAYLQQHQSTATFQNFGETRMTTYGSCICKGVLKCIDQKYVCEKGYTNLNLEDIRIINHTVYVTAKFVNLTESVFTHQMNCFMKTIVTLCHPMPVPEDVKKLSQYFVNTNTWRKWRKLVLNHPSMFTPSQVEQMVCAFTNICKCSYFRELGIKRFLELVTVPKCGWVMHVIDSIENMPESKEVLQKVLEKSVGVDRMTQEGSKKRREHEDNQEILEYMRSVFSHFFDHDIPSDFFDLENCLHSLFPLLLGELAHNVFSLPIFDEFFI